MNSCASFCLAIINASFSSTSHFGIGFNTATIPIMSKSLTSRLRTFFVSVVTDLDQSNPDANKAVMFNVSRKAHRQKPLLSMLAMMGFTPDTIPTCAELFTRLRNEISDVNYVRDTQIEVGELLCRIKGSILTGDVPVEIARAWKTTSVLEFLCFRWWMARHHGLPHLYLLAGLTSTLPPELVRHGEDHKDANTIDCAARTWFTTEQENATKHIIASLRDMLLFERDRIVDFLGIEHELPICARITSIVMDECKQVVMELQVNASQFASSTQEQRKATLAKWVETNTKLINRNTSISQNRTLCKVFIGQWGAQINAEIVNMTQHIQLLHRTGFADDMISSRVRSAMNWITKTMPKSGGDLNLVDKIFAAGFPFEFKTLVYNTIQNAAYKAKKP